jgi:hypothetical protein
VNFAGPVASSVEKLNPTTHTHVDVDEDKREEEILPTKSTNIGNT